MNKLNQKMKIKLKSLLSVFLVLVILLLSVPYTSVSAVAYEAGTEIENGYPLKVTFDTEKDSYGSLSTARYDVTIENTSNKTVENISAKCGLDSIQPIDANSVLEIDAVDLKAGESCSFTFYATVKSSKLNFILSFFLLLKNLFASRPANPDSDFDNGRSYIKANTDVKYGSIAVNETVTVWFDDITEVVMTNSEQDYMSQAATLVSAQMNSSEFNLKDAESNEFYSRRVIVEGKNVDSIDLTKYAPTSIIYNADKTQAIVQCGTQELTQKCEAELNTLSNLEYAETDVLMKIESYDVGQNEATAQAQPNWGKGYIKADSYEYYLENNNYFDMVTVAVVDTGVDLDHSFLKNRITSNGFDIVDGDNVADDGNGHGTHVAGIIADCTDGLNVKILPVRVLNNKGVGYSSTIAQGIRQAANSGADVINLSLGGDKSNYIDSAVEYAVKKGIVVCAASGNGDEKNNPVDTTNISPANCSEAIVVGAIDNTGKIASFSNYGSSVDVVAPGVDIYSAYKNGSYAKLSGTSMATPHIAATAAMFRLSNENLSPEEIEKLIKDYCKDLGAAGRDNTYGHGVVNMYNAIPDCTVRFDSNGGTSVSDKNVKNTDEITLPMPTKSYTVKLNANGGSISQSVYTRECKLEGWYKSSSLTGTRYAPDELYMAKSTEVLYAKWENPTLGAVNAPTRTNYDFLGWYTSATGGTEYTSDSNLTGNITLYARWEQVTNQIPDYNNWDVNSAINSLTSLGMKYTTSYAYNNNYASGKVYGQSVSAYSEIPVGSTVTLYVSSGPRSIAVGDYVNYHGGTTLYKTIAGGLKNGVYKADPSGGYCTGIYTYNGTVYYQFQYAGASEPFGWAPAYYFSLG